MRALGILLKASVMESENIKIDFVKVSHAVLELILGQKNLFERLPRKLHVIAEPLKEIPLPMSGNTRIKDDVEFFEKKAVLLYDGIAASAMGAHNYIYRSKGVRVYLFEGGDVSILTPYSIIDDRGFFIENEIWGGIGDFNIYERYDCKDLIELFDSIQSNNDDFRKIQIGKGLVDFVCNIKKPFKKDYYLEYLLTPPDVDVLSDFSLDARQALWDIALSDEFESLNGVKWKNKAMEFLIQANISPNPFQIIEYIRGQKNSDGSDIQQFMRRLDTLEANLGGAIKGIARDFQSEEFWRNIFGDVYSDRSNEVVNFKNFPTAQGMTAIVDEIILLFKSQIEDRGLWKELWFDEVPRYESTVQNLFFSMATAFCEAFGLDITPEANLGNGPVDFKMSKGNRHKAVVEFKLSTNTSLIQGYTAQLEAYKRADKTEYGFFVVVDVGGIGNSVQRLNEAKADCEENWGRASEIFIIDGKPKLSASKRK